MELLQEIGKRQYGSSTRSFGLFECPVCKTKVEKSLSHGKRDKNCGSKECRKATFEPNRDVAVKLTKHGYSRDPNFRTFERIHSSMKQRCHNEKDTAYQYYGAKGIAVCERWQTLANFAIDMFPSYKAMMNEWDGTTSGRPSLDRNDPFGDYTPENCTWIRYGDNAVKDKTIPVVRMDFDGNILETYPSMTDAAQFKSIFGARTMQASISNIWQCCNGKASEHVGYKWAFASNKTAMQKQRLEAQ